MPDEIATPHPRFGRDRWPERLGGRVVRSVDAYGKHLFLRFEGDLVIHSHLRMTGSWRVRPTGPAPSSAWLVIRRDGQDVVQLRGPVLELMTESRTRFDQRLAGLGPDILAAELDEAALPAPACATTTRRAGSATRCSTSGRSPASATCGRARAASPPAIDPWRPVGQVSDEEALAIVRETRPRMQASAADGMPGPLAPGLQRRRAARARAAAGRTDPRRGQGDDNRPTFWCPSCQH